MRNQKLTKLRMKRKTIRVGFIDCLNSKGLNRILFKMSGTSWRCGIHLEKSLKDQEHRITSPAIAKLRTTPKFTMPIRLTMFNNSLKQVQKYLSKTTKHHQI